MALTRRDSEERQQALLNFFLSRPDATGEDGQRALVGGSLLGKKGPPMGLHMLFRIKRQADQLRSTGAAQVANVPSAVSPSKIGPILAELRELAAKLQKALESLPDVTEVKISRTGMRIVRLRAQEETL